MCLNSGEWQRPIFYHKNLFYREGMTKGKIIEGNTVIE